MLGDRTRNSSLIQALPDVSNLKVTQFQIDTIFKNIKNEITGFLKDPKFFLIVKKAHRDEGGGRIQMVTAGR
jgi:hypothetical protein